MIKRIRRDDLLQSAKDIFGDIVRAVYSDAYIYEENKLEDYITGGELCKATFRKGILSYCEDLIIEFTNGRLVMFRASEWADMGIASEREIVDPHA